MKKVMLLAGVACFLFASCCSKGDKCPSTATTDTTCKNESEHKCCKEMSEEQKQACADWKNWENIDDVRKATLLQEKKEVYDQCKAEREKIDAERASLDAKMADWDKLSLDEKKVLIDEVKMFGKAHRHHQKDQNCCSHKEKEEEAGK